MGLPPRQAWPGGRLPSRWRPWRASPLSPLSRRALRGGAAVAGQREAESGRPGSRGSEMKQKKPRGLPARPGPARKRKGVSDISPSTSLPPLVEGQLRCFLKLTISKILWMVPKPPAAFLIRVRWWGETSDGTIFMPRDSSQAEQKTLKTTTRYPVRCGPKQFASYLTDMGALVLEVMTKSDHLPIGRVQISGLAQLSPTHPINGFFTVISPTSEKMGELQVSLVLEPLSETFDSSGSVQNTDVSFGVGLPAWGAKQATESSQFLVPSQFHRPPGVSIMGRESISSSRASTPRGKDHLYFQENSENVKDDLFEPQYHHLAEQTDSLNVNAPKQQGLLSGSFDHEAQMRLAGRSPDPVHIFDWHNPATKDLLSALLDKGNKLRNAMVASTMKSSPDHVSEFSEAHPPLKNNVSKSVRKLNFRNLKSGLESAVEDPLQLPLDNLEFDMHAESGAVQLLFDSTDFSTTHLLGGTSSPPESVSLGSDVYDSELNDPHYDQSLLENLFYTATKSDSSHSDFPSEEEDAVSSGKVNKSHGTKRWRSEKPLESSPLCQKGKDLKTTDNNSPTRPLPHLSTSMEPAEETQAVNLSLDRLTVLGRIHLARVVIESLKIPPEDNAQGTSGKKSAVGKPPRPTLARKRTFFVEYHFPVGASKNGVGQVAITTEIVRVASSKIIGEAVKFQQRYVFPVHFSGIMITHWWNSDLEFHIYLKKGTQRKPLLTGSAAFRLRDVILSKQLIVSCELPVKEDGGPAQLGPLKVSLELAADNKDFSSAGANARTVNFAPPAPVYSVRSPGLKLQEPDRTTASVKSPQLLKQNNCQFLKSTQEPLPTDLEKSRDGIGQQSGPTLASSGNLLAQIIASEEDGLLLHVLLMIPEGKDFVSRDAGIHRPCNVYLNCKLFSTEETTRSAVIWGTTQPTFHFSQVTPFSLTPKLLERLKNNVMVIEAWNKIYSPGKDRLLGLVKLPLHQFYVSFKDPKISSLLLQAQYPVLAVDGFMPVIDVFTGNNIGSLKVILAMGSAEQVVALQRLKNEEGTAPPIMLRPVHSLDPLAMPVPKPSEQEGKGFMEHIFEIHIESVKGLTPLQSTVWGEADCYVQYHFPVQESESSVLCGTESCENGIELKPFRSVTTLCVPDPIFSDERHHLLLVPADVPVQRLLLSAFSAEGLAGGGGIPFEIWCRYYYPNVRDQMVAKGTLPLSRLCAMVTMQHREKVGIQTFSLPLVSRTESYGEFHPRSSGLLDVSIKYRRTLKTDDGVMAARAVSISVQIHAAAGLQAAARVMAEKNPSLQHSVDVGINTYVSVHLPFLPKSEKRSTRAVARTFCPDFEFHAEFPCNLIVRRSNGETCSLGELLQFSEIIFSVFHRSLKSAPGATKTQTPKDYLLGTVKVPTRDLLIRRSGIRGWHPIILPEEVMPSHRAGVMQTVVGGLELSISFAHPGHRERVLDAAKLLDWNWKDTHTENMWDDGEWQPPPNSATVTVSIPRLWLPVHCVLLAGQTQINKSVYCYLRYKLYDQKATWTLLRRPKLAGDETQVTMTFKRSKQVDLPWSQALLWYFREERLELQVWRAYGNESNVERPLDTDHLIGSAYVDLSMLGQSSRKMRTISGVFPLFRRNASNLLGAAVRIHVALARCSPQCLEPAEDSTGSSSECEEKSKAPEQDQPNLEHPSHKSGLSAVEIPNEKLPEESSSAHDQENTFAVSILVERAMHLSLKGSPLTERGVLAPSSYVSFVTADADNPITTEIVETTDSPVWGFQQQTSLSKELLLDPQQCLVFKVWHKAEVERVIGFASVDLSPLLSGFQLVCGWYNITDFSGQCQGQIKVAISPLESIAHLKEERQARSQTKITGSLISAMSPFALQMRDLYAALPSFSTRGTKDLLSSPLKDTDATKQSTTGSLESKMLRHEEHMQNIRRFHESLQQAEGNMHQARSLDILSHASHSALLKALRKNLSELDEIQRYFSQKLNRSFPDLGAINRDKDELGASHHHLVSRIVDTEGRHLLEKSNHLVSQVSILINDLQSNGLKNTEDSSNSQENHGQCLHVNLAPSGVPDKKNGIDRTEVLRGHLRNQSSSVCVEEEEVPLLLGEPPCERGMLYEFLGQASSQGDPVHCSQREEEADVSHSEEEYEEDVIEPRTLNEITTMTDKTSPWSSLVSETEQDPDQEAVIRRNAEQLPGAAEHIVNVGSIRGSLLSIETKDGPQNMPSPVRSVNSPFGEEKSDECMRRQVLECGSEELLQPTSVSAANPEEGRPTETQKADCEGSPGMQDRGACGEIIPSLDNGDFAVAKAAAAEVKERTGSLYGELPGEELNTNEESPQCCFRLSDTALCTGSNASKSPENPPEDSEKPPKASVVLSDPVVVPNFFLPVQHLEASMRLLSVSPSLLAASSKTGSSAAAGGMPSRRPNRHKPRLTPAEVPEEETKRIARIFSAQFSKDK